MAEWLRRLTRNQFSSEAEVRVLSATIQFFFFWFFVPGINFLENGLFYHTFHVFCGFYEESGSTHKEKKEIAGVFGLQRGKRKPRRVFEYYLLQSFRLDVQSKGKKTNRRR